MPGQINIINTKFPFVVGGVGQYISIQTAINEASVIANSTNIQSVLVNPGTYNEDIVLKDFVNLCSFGSTVESTIILGNASYPSTSGGASVSVSGITFQTPGLGGSAFDISATSVINSTIYFNNCNFHGTTGNCFTSSTASGNATIFMNNINMTSNSGFNAFDFSNIPSYLISIGNITISGVDTPSNIDGINMTILGVNITDSFNLTNGAVLEIGDGFLSTVATFPLMQIDVSSTGVLSNVVTQVGSTYAIAGTGSFYYSDIFSTVGLDPGLNFDTSYSSFFEKLQLNEPLSGFNGGTGISNSGLTINLSSGSSGLVLTSDNAGNATWQSVSGSGAITEIDGDSGSMSPTAGVVTISGGTTGLTTTASVSTMDLTGILVGDNGGTGIANSGLTIDLGSASIGYVLTSDNAGNATWQASSGGITTIDGDSGSVTGSTINIVTNVAGNNSGSSLEFTGSGTTLTLNTTDSNTNTIIGKFAGNASISGSNNVGYGAISLQHLTSGSGNVCLGVNSGNAMTSALDQIAIGLGALASSQADQDNVAIGTFSMSSTNGGTGNTGIGTLALSFNANSNYNVALGFQSLYHLTGGGGENFGLGGLSLTNLLTGSNNLAVGFQSGTSYTGTESSNILFNSSGVIADNNTLRIGASTGGSTGSLNQSFICGIYGITTTSATTSTVLISDGDQLGTIASSRRYKDNIIDIPQSDFMQKIRPVQFNYKAHKSSDISYGFIAEEVIEVAPQLVNLDKEGQPESVKYHELYALLLKEIQDLRKEVNELKLARK